MRYKKIVISLQKNIIYTMLTLCKIEKLCTIWDNPYCCVCYEKAIRMGHYKNKYVLRITSYGHEKGDMRYETIKTYGTYLELKNDFKEMMQKEINLMIPIARKKYLQYLCE